MATTTDPSRGRVNPAIVDHSTSALDTASPVNGGSVDGLTHCMLGELLELTVRHPDLGVCVVAVKGEVDMLSAPMLEACVREQLAAAPAHLILDLGAVRFLGSSGLDCLLRARELAQQTTEAHLHLAGLVTRAVARPLEVTGLLEQFDTYPCVTDALTSLTDSAEVMICTGQAGLLSVIGRLDERGLTQLRRQLQALFDIDTQYLVVNLAGVISCDYRLFGVLIWAHQFLAARQGWMRLVGLGPTVRNTLDEATLSECLFVDQASDWTGILTGGSRPDG